MGSRSSKSRSVILFLNIHYVGLNQLNAPLLLLPLKVCIRMYSGWRCLQRTSKYCTYSQTFAFSLLKNPPFFKTMIPLISSSLSYLTIILVIPYGCMLPQKKGAV